MTQLDRIEAELVRLRRLVEAYISGGIVAIMSDLSALQAQVAANVSVEQSAITLIQGLAAQLAANANDPAAISAMATSLQTSAASLAAAITANTPAASTTTPAAGSPSPTPVSGS
jgi:hypothetical protein